MKTSVAKRGRRSPAGKAVANEKHESDNSQKKDFSNPKGPAAETVASCKGKDFPPGEVWFSHPRLSHIRAGESLMGYGARGSGVALIQNAIVAWGCDEGIDNLLPKFGADGIFGSETLSAIKTFQNGRQIKIDGIVGPVTLGELDQFITGGQLTCPTGTTTAAFAGGTGKRAQQDSCTPPGTVPQAKKCPCGCPLPAASGANPSVGDVGKVKKNASSVDDNNHLFCPNDGDPVKVIAKESNDFMKVELLKHANKKVHINRNFLKDCKPLAIKPETVFPAPDGSGKNRKAVGVGEKVNFKTRFKGNWTATNGTPNSRTNLNPFVWTAPKRGGKSTIAFSLGSATTSIDISVVEPSAIKAKKLNEISIPPGKAGAGMKLRFHYLPKIVSFGNVQSKEVSGPASLITGYYQKNFTKEQLKHDSGDKFFDIKKNNEDSVVDTASEIRSTKPFDVGTYQWVIPNHFRLKTESGDGKKFTDVTQFFHMMDKTGKMKVLKAGAKVINP